MAEEPDEAAERGSPLVRERVEEHVPPLQEVAEVVGVLGIALPPGPVQRPAVVVRHGVGDQHDVGAVGFQELRQGHVVGACGFHGADDLGDAGLGLPLRQVGPEGGEARLGVRDRELSVQELRVGEADLGHVLGLRHIDPHEEPVPPPAEIRLEVAKALDTDCIGTDGMPGASPSVRGSLGLVCA